MPVQGRKPKPEGQARNRNKPVHDWVEVVDVPFVGESPDLPDDAEWSSFTERWWGVVRSLPHAVNWHPGDWLNAIECAFVVEKHWEDPTAELRLRERNLGMTTDALRDLRIRYVPLCEVGAEENVTQISDYGGFYGSR